MKIIFLIFTIFVLSGCTSFARVPGLVTNKTLNEIGQPLTILVNDWCNLKDYRQEGLGILVNGKLAEVDSSISVNCNTTEVTQ